MKDGRINKAYGGTIIDYIKNLLKPNSNFTSENEDDINTIGVTVFYYIEGEATIKVFNTLIDDIEGAKINQDVFIKKIINSGIHKNITEKDMLIVKLTYT